MMIPSQSYSFSGIVATLYFFFLFSFVPHTLTSPKHHHCRHDQRDALLEFKHEFPVNESEPSSWNKSGDCCSWEAVECNSKGQVISLELDYVPLNNSLKPNSALFKLQYLQNLSLFHCNLYGEIPSSFGNLSHLTMLDLSSNELTGQVPASIGNLTQLRYLNLGGNNLSGKFSVSFANLTKFSKLYLGYNSFEPELLPDMRRFHNLEEFDVRGNSFFGPFPTSLFTIPSLQIVNLMENNFKGPIDFGNISLSSRLQSLNLRDNTFTGPFPKSLLTILSLQYVNLMINQLEGHVDFGNISSSSRLQDLMLANNKFDGPIPESISKLSNLSYLDLSNNKFEGKLPACLWRLKWLILSNNSFSSFGKSSEVLDQTQMLVLQLDSNSFYGPFPQWICKHRSLELLDLSNNSFNGSIPPCFGNSTKSLGVLNLRNNNFSGVLPDMFANATYLQALDISHNRFEGKLPKSLINCEEMKLLNVAENKFKDEFPSWLGSLQWLNVLILKSNQFFGPLYHQHVSIRFQSLKVIDVSHNDYSGTFPAFYFSNWIAMTTVNADSNDIIDMYMSEVFNNSGFYPNSVRMVHKGVDTEFEKIPRDFITIDFSGNRFRGKIPESIGLLKGLRHLNLSNNAFTSNIPQSLANLKVLETLDLSRNQLSGQIPRDLGILSFLSTMDFSHNNLEGPVPRGTQFQSQNCSSFMDNPKLYGLDDICGKTHVPKPTPQESEEVSEQEEQVINWIAAAIAYGPGVFCGLVIGHIFVSLKHEWFMEKFSRNKSSVVIRGTH